MKLAPQEFWSLSPREWRWLVDAAAPARPSFAEIAALAKNYPDKDE